MRSLVKHPPWSLLLLKLINRTFIELKLVENDCPGCFTENKDKSFIRSVNLREGSQTYIPE